MEEGPRTYLGIGMAGFPNLFLITGPQSPSVSATWSSPSNSTSTGSLTASHTCVSTISNDRGDGRSAQDKWVEHARHALPAGQFLVRRGECRGQAARLHVVSRRCQCLPADVRQDRGQRLRGVRLPRSLCVRDWSQGRVGLIKAATAYRHSSAACWFALSGALLSARSPGLISIRHPLDPAGE
jgi:hypothetical protein